MRISKINSTQIDYIIVFIMVVMSAGVSFLGATIFRFLLLVVVLGVIFLRNRPINLRNFKFIILFYIVWCAGVILTFEVNLVQSGQLFTYLSFFTLVLASYYAAVALYDFFSTYIKVIYHLAIISFIFYILQLTSFNIFIIILESFDALNSIFKGFRSNPSIVIYSYVPREAGLIFRNFGFATEPGEFSVFLILALMLQVTRNNFTIDRIVIVLIIAVLTTVSTAGYLGLVILFIYMLFNKRSIFNKMWFSLLAIPAIILIINQDFVLEKVENAWEVEAFRYEQAHQERITPGRIGSLLLDLNDFKENPIVGYGIHQDTRYANYGGVEQQRTNGVSDYLVKFGVIGFLIMLYNFHRTLYSWEILNNKQNSYFLILSILTVAFAQVILLTPIFLALQFHHFQ